MTKQTNKRKPTIKKARKPPNKMASPPPMPPPSRITTAPVAIGNSVRGTGSNSRFTNTGVIVSGRDFMFQPIGSGTVTTWCLVGGTPITPAAFADSTIRNYMQMYQKFRWRAFTAHYITSSPTSANGDVMFYRAKNRDSVFVSQTSSQLLQLVLSDPNSVLGPQWTNHSTAATVSSNWKSTDFGMSDDINEYSDGELFLLSKTSTTDSPGYVIFDYVIEFAELQITPRLLSLPLPRIQYSQANVGLTAFATGNTTQVKAAVTGNNLSGLTSVIPNGCVQGDIYKVIIDLTNSASGSWTNVTPSNLMAIYTSSNTSSATSFTIVDGTTLYAVYGSDGSFYFYTSVPSAFTAVKQLVNNVGAVNITFNLQCWFSLIGTMSSTNLSPNY